MMIALFVLGPGVLAATVTVAHRDDSELATPSPVTAGFQVYSGNSESAPQPSRRAIPEFHWDFLTQCPYPGPEGETSWSREPCVTAEPSASPARFCALQVPEPELFDSGHH